MTFANLDWALPSQRIFLTQGWYLLLRQCWSKDGNIQGLRVAEAAGKTDRSAPWLAADKDAGGHYCALSEPTTYTSQRDWNHIPSGVPLT